MRKTAVPQGHEADPFPEYVSPDWGITVACGEGRCDRCPGTRWAWASTNRFREERFVSQQACQGSRVTTVSMTTDELKQHLIDHHGYTWQTANHPSHSTEWLERDHRQSHEDGTSKYLDHDHETR